jgi:hypothetical protein
MAREPHDGCREPHDGCREPHDGCRQPSGYICYMRRLFYLPILFLALAYDAQGQSNFQAIEHAFVHIPDSVQTSVYWYWINGNISKEGVVKDLEAMKKVGINRAFIGNIGLDGDPYGKVKMFSDEWWAILHTTLKTATRLNIQIGIFNGPGWSQSGGPWIKPGQSMRYLTSSQTMVSGPVDFHRQLPKADPAFQDVKVLAYPVPEDYGQDIGALHPVLTSTPAMDSLGRVMDHDVSSSIPLSAGQPFSLGFETKDTFTVRSVSITTTAQNVRLEGNIQALVNNAYTNVKHFVIDRTNSALNVGFIPFGPATISIPPTASTGFRVSFTSVSANSGIAEISLSGTPRVENYLEKTLAKMWPTPHPFWEAYQWQPQPDEGSGYVIDPASVRDISSFLDTGGMLHWAVPSGKWVIERTGMTPTKVTNSPAPPEGRGLEVDKMSTEHVAEHFQAFLGEILKRIPAEDRKTFKVTVEDSYETGGQNWTDKLIPEFRDAFGYDPTPYLPVLQGKVVGSEDMSDRFLWDLRRLIADDVSFKYVGGLRQISHRNGLTTWLENYGHWGYPGEFLQYGGQSDEVGGEFWSEGDLGDIENRAASSSAHIYGKTKVSAESFTAGGAPFYRYPAMFKKRGDRFFTEGINNTLLHVYIEQPADTPLPGKSTWFGVEFNRLNTWFFDMDILLQYLKRCNLMLQQGKYAADAAYFIGEDAPKMIGITDPPLPQGYSYDYINGDVIRQRLTVSKGKLTLPNGISYRLLVLPKLETMRPELLAKIKTLVFQGAVVMGPKPLRSPSLAGYPQADRLVSSMADSLWGDTSVKIHHYGKGIVLNGMSMQEAFDLLKVIPDLRVSGSDSILFIHRQLPDGSIYFVSSQKAVPTAFSASFRVRGKRPELWNAIDGSCRDLPVYSIGDSSTTVPLELAPYESAFIVFRNSGAAVSTGAAPSNYPRVARVLPISGPWTVSFDTAMWGPLKPVEFDSLSDWSKNGNDSIKYYSGTAWYHHTFGLDTVTAGSHYVLDLGGFAAIAKVYINGVYIGGLWTPPYQVNITGALRAGENKVDIKIVNTWMNRLVGDARLPAAERKTSVLYGPGAQSGLEPSGLFGPVLILEEQ